MIRCYFITNLGLSLCHWVPCGILYWRVPKKRGQYFQRKPPEVSMCTVGSAATDCTGSLGGEKSFHILGSRDLNSNAASLVMAVGSSGKADTAVWHLIIRLPIVSPEEWQRGSRGKKKEAIIILLQLFLYLSSSVSFIPFGILAGPLGRCLFRRRPYRCRFGRCRWKPTVGIRVAGGAADWLGPSGEGHGILPY